MQEQFISHPIPPTWNEHSEILILGSFPSVKSREAAYFYGHPQNRFWRVLAALFEESVPETKEERKAFLLRHHIAVWDVIASCRITGSSDSSIKDVKVNDLTPILSGAPIRQIFVCMLPVCRLPAPQMLPGQWRSWFPPGPAFWKISDHSLPLCYSHPQLC